METVQLFDSETKTTTEIPEAELAPGYICATVEGIEGEVFIDASKVKMKWNAKNYDFTEIMPFLRKLHKRVKEVYPVTLKRWVGGFQAERDPEKEIVLWSLMADRYEKAIAGRKLTTKQKKQYFGVILSAVNNGVARALQLADLSDISRDEAEEILAGLTE